MKQLEMKNVRRDLDKTLGSSIVMRLDAFITSSIFHPLMDSLHQSLVGSVRREERRELK